VSVDTQVRPAALTRPTPMRIALGYLELTKPRITLLVVMTGVPALLMAGAGFPGPARFWGTLAGIALASMAAASFNHYVDRDIDGLMVRTRLRPLPAGLFPPVHALVTGAVLTVAAWLVLDRTANRLAAVIAMLSIFYYAVVYSIWLKRRTPQNIVIGGGAGASAPLIAWAAVTGQLAVPAWLLASIIFLWTPPHFWALSLYRRDDYARAGLPMLPVTHGEPETRRQIVLYSFALVALTLSVVPFGPAGPLYGVPAVVGGALFIAYALRLRRSGTIPHAVALFRYSILYLFLLFAFLTADAAVRAASRAGT